MQDLNGKIIDWADNKGILSNSRPLKQLTKTFEEVTELVTALVNKDQDEIVDSIGDINVTLIILKKLSEQKDNGDLAGSKVFMAINWIVEIFQKVCNNKEISIDVARAQTMLDMVAKDHGVTLEQCTESAYNVIAKRTGKMVDGVFVKDFLEQSVAVKPATKKALVKTKEVKNNE